MNINSLSLSFSLLPSPPSSLSLPPFLPPPPELLAPPVKGKITASQRSYTLWAGTYVMSNDVSWMMYMSIRCVCLCTVHIAIMVIWTGLVQFGLFYGRHDVNSCSIHNTPLRHLEYVTFSLSLSLFPPVSLPAAFLSPFISPFLFSSLFLSCLIVCVIVSYMYSVLS